MKKPARKRISLTLADPRVIAILENEQSQFMREHGIAITLAAIIHKCVYQCFPNK
jgi:hypothetical protein